MPFMLKSLHLGVTAKACRRRNASGIPWDLKLQEQCRVPIFTRGAPVAYQHQQAYLAYTNMSQKAHHFVNDGHSALASGIQGLLNLDPSLQLDEKHKVVYRNDKKRDERVTIISGGGSGHEPAHAGFVGPGMLDAAVCGAIFASPNATQIEAGLTAIQSPKGILIVVKNYTGDKLNFTLAADRFRLAGGAPTRLIVVADDVSIGRTRSALVGRRGLAGTALIHKIVGGASAAGLSLDDVAKAAEYAISNMGTIGVGLDGCHVPGQASKPRLSPDEVEIGIGIHNEPGSRRIKPRPSLEDLIKDMVANILKDDPERNYLQSPPKADHHDTVLLINNLGGLSPLEISAITNTVCLHLQAEYSLKPIRVYAGTFLSSLNCPGFSITLLSLPKATSLSAQILNWLDLRTDALGWTPSLATEIWDSTDSQNTQSTVDIGPNKHREIPTVPCDERLFQTILKAVHENIVLCEPQITHNDTILGDGDCGATLVDGSTCLINAVKDQQINTRSLSHGMLKIADLISLSMGGTSGALYAVFVTAFASAIATDQAVSCHSISMALRSGLSSLEQVTAARVGDRTMMDALIPFVDQFCSGGSDGGMDTLTIMSAALAASRQGCEDTAALKSKFGRSTYVGAEDRQDSSTSVPDPGAMGIVAILSGIEQALQL